MTNEAAWSIERMADKAAWSKGEFSQSRMKDLIDCSYKYYLQRVDRTKNRSTQSASLPMGTAFHAAAEAFHNALRKGFEPDLDLIIDIAKSTFHDEYKNHVSDSSMGYSKQDKPFATTPLHEIDGAMERAVKNVQWWVVCYIEAYNRGELSIMDTIEVGCEVDYRRFFPELGIFLRGKLDLVFNDKHVGDWKTVNVNKMWQFCQSRADGEIQADWYAAIMLGSEEGEVTFSYVTTEKQPHPEFQKEPMKNKDGSYRKYKGQAPVFPKKCEVKVISTTRTHADVKKLMERVKLALLVSDLMNDHKDGFFVRNPAGDGYNYCGKMCDFKDECYTRLIKEREGSQ
jgi:hypothetical protein